MSRQYTCQFEAIPMKERQSLLRPGPGR